MFTGMAGHGPRDSGAPSPKAIIVAQALEALRLGSSGAAHEGCALFLTDGETGSYEVWSSARETWANRALRTRLDPGDRPHPTYVDEDVATWSGELAGSPLIEARWRESEGPREVAACAIVGSGAPTLHDHVRFADVLRTIGLWLCQESAHAPAESPFQALMADACPWGLVLAGARGLVRFANARAKTMLARGDIAVLKDGRLRLRRAALDRTLQTRLAALTAKAPCRLDNPAIVQPSAMCLPDAQGNAAVALQVEPVPRTRYGEAEDARAVITLTELRRCVAPSRCALASLFSLSDKEAELAALFARGLNLETAAAEMGVARNTAKVHLRHVLAKTGTHSQVDLARLLATLPSRPCDQG